MRYIRPGIRRLSHYLTFRVPPRATFGLASLVAGLVLAVGGSSRDAPATALARVTDVPAAPAMAFPPEVRPTFIWPVMGMVSSEMDASHPLGIDIGLAHSPEAPIVATAGGLVTFAGGTYCCSYGYHVIVDHAGGYQSLYAHFSEVLVNEGDIVQQGQVLGIGGDSGFSTSEHLHFEMHHAGERIDPLPLMPRHGAPED